MKKISPFYAMRWQERERLCQWLKRLVMHYWKQIFRFRIFNETWPGQFDGFSDIFIVGGDGTLNYFINRYPGVQLPLVLFKGGTGNDFHWLLYGDQTLEAQLQLALNAKAKPIDIAKCNERYFINGLGIGFEGAVVRSCRGKKNGLVKPLFLSAF